MALGYDGRLFLLALAGPHADVLLDAVEHARGADGVRADEVAVLVDGRAEPELARRAKERAIPLALTADDRGQERFALADEDDFAGLITELEPEVNAVRLRWHPDDAAETKKAQALGLTKLAAWLHETDRHLLIELVVPATDEAAAGPTREAIREIRELGADADLWSVAGAADAEAAEALGRLVEDAGRDRVAVLARPEAGTEAEAVARACAPVAAYRGLQFDVRLWADELASFDAGGRAREDVVRTIGARIADLIDLYTAASSA